MINIEVKKRNIEDEDGFKSVKKYLVVNGIVDEDSFYSEDDYTSAHFYNDEIINILLNYSFNEVGKSLSEFTFDLEVEWWANQFSLDIYCDKYYHIKIPSIKVDLQIVGWEHWSKPWSMSSLAKEFESNIINIGNEQIRYWQDDPDSILNGFGVNYYPCGDTLVIKREVNYLLDILKKVAEKTNKNLLESLDGEVVLTYFQFPEEIKTACKQYLIYFTQFIADMGIIVDSELKEELNHTLFKVIPKDKNESLDKIREALNIYLNAPGDQNFQVQISNQTDIAAKQWEANFYHLKSQLSLAASIIQAKETAIENLQLSNYQYKQFFESHSLKKESEKEDVIPGILALKKFEGKGFSIDLAEIFRRLKRSFKK